MPGLTSSPGNSGTAGPGFMLAVVGATMWFIGRCLARRKYHGVMVLGASTGVLRVLAAVSRGRLPGVLTGELHRRLHVTKHNAGVG